VSVYRCAMSKQSEVQSCQNPVAQVLHHSAEPLAVRQLRSGPSTTVPCNLNLTVCS
jgi:hypothetical protein